MSPRRLHPALLRGYLAVFVVLAGAYFVLDDPTRLVWTALTVLAVSACAVGTLLQATETRTPWWLITASVALLATGDAVYDWLTIVLGQEQPFPSLADVAYIAMYPVVALGLALLVRARTPGGDGAAVLDSATITVSVGLLMWVFVAAPSIEGSEDWLTNAVSVAYPLGDVLVLAVLARLLLVPGPRLSSLRLLALGAVGLLGSDVLYTLASLAGTWAVGGVTDLGWLVFYAAWGAAALHPDMPRLTHVVPVQHQVTPPWRLALIALVPLIPPGLLLTEFVRGASYRVPLIPLSSTVLVLLVAARLNGAVAAARNSTRREAVLRRVSEAMVAVESRGDVVRLAAGAVTELVGGARRVVVGSLIDDHEVHDSAAGGSTNLRGHQLLTDMVLLHQRALATHRFALLDKWQQAAVGVTDSRVLLVGLHREGVLTGALLVAGRGVERPDTIDSVCALSTQVVLALDSAEAARLELQRKSEALFRSLIQNAADVIVTVDDGFAVRFQTPSAHSILGWEPGATSGRRLDELVVAEDRDRARKLLHHAAAAHDGRTAAVDGELHIADRGGEIRVFEVSSSNLLDDPHVHGIVVTLHDVTDRRRLESQLKHQAFHDPLTELPNRALFLDRVEHALARRGRHSGGVAVMLIDLDDFKLVNDTRGHSVGDALLVQVADRLRRTVREEDTCARLGGDEFAVLMEGLDSHDEAIELAERISFALRQSVVVEGETVNAGASIGVATTEHAENAADLLRQSDLAMYAAKDTGGASTSRYRPSMQDSMHARAQLARDLERAIREQEFVLHYQPVVSLEDGRLLGAEALIRWQHPERGLVLPGGFIDAVERSELGVALGQWVIEEAVTQAVAWRSTGTVGADFRINVNVAPRQLADAGLVDLVADTLRTHGLPPEALVLEITERVLAGNEPETVEVMNRLHAAGVRLVLDDFGTGYSALSYLRRFPVSGLKIDRSFVSGLDTSADDAALVEAIVRLAQTFDLDLVAEGVETGSQSLALSRLGCGKAQGFLYSPPLPADEITSRLTHDLHATHATHALVPAVTAPRSAGTPREGNPS